MNSHSMLETAKQLRPDQRSEPSLRASMGNNGRELAFEIKNLSVYFGDHHVLKNISLPIGARTVTAIIGPSGCGKSTLLRALNRMHDLVPKARLEGEVRLFGDPIFGKDVDPVQVRRRVGMVFQKSNPFPTMCIAENETVGLRLNGLKQRGLLEERLE